jgi:hypothetical protein
MIETSERACRKQYAIHVGLNLMRGLTAGERRVAHVVVSEYRYRAGCARPEVGFIAAALGRSERQVRRALASLVEKGVFTVTTRKGRGHTNEYRPNPEIARAAEPLLRASGD